MGLVNFAFIFSSPFWGLTGCPEVLGPNLKLFPIKSLRTCVCSQTYTYVYIHIIISNTNIIYLYIQVPNHALAFSEQWKTVRDVLVKQRTSTVYHKD